MSACSTFVSFSRASPVSCRCYFPGVLVGPYLTYAEYSALVDESLFKSAGGKTKPGRAIPLGRKRVAYYKMLSGLVYLGLFVVLGGSFNYGVALTPWFTTKNLIYRSVSFYSSRKYGGNTNLGYSITYFQFCGVIERCKYYAIWTLTEVFHNTFTPQLSLTIIHRAPAS